VAGHTADVKFAFFTHGISVNFSIGSSFQTLVIQMSLLCRRWKVVAGISVSAVRTTSCGVVHGGAIRGRERVKKLIFESGVS
jgi:hypothetical protein